jgi:hypothetical protein
MKISSLVVTVLLLLCFSAQAQTSFPDDAEIKNGVYYNSFFNFSFAYPKDWVVPGEALKKRIKERANEEAVKNGNSAYMKDSYLLLTVSRQPLGTQSNRLNPTILVAAEKISDVPGNPNAKDFLLGYREVKTRDGLTSSLAEPVPFRVAGFLFFRDDYAGTLNGISIRQSIFVHFRKGYAIAFTFTGDDEKAVVEMAKTMQTIEAFGSAGPRVTINDRPPK